MRSPAAASQPTPAGGRTEHERFLFPRSIPQFVPRFVSRAGHIVSAYIQQGCTFDPETDHLDVQVGFSERLAPEVYLWETIYGHDRKGADWVVEQILRRGFIAASPRA
jgi:hypothetical protein